MYFRLSLPFDSTYFLTVPSDAPEVTTTQKPVSLSSKPDDLLSTPQSSSQQISTQLSTMKTFIRDSFGSSQVTMTQKAVTSSSQRNDLISTPQSKSQRTINLLPLLIFFAVTSVCFILILVVMVGFLIKKRLGQNKRCVL